MTKDTSRKAYTLISFYQKLYKDKYGKVPGVNKYREKWGMVDMIDSWGFDQTKELLEYYFKTGEQGHGLTNFYNKSDKLLQMKNTLDYDAQKRRAIMEETRRRVEQEDED